MTNKQETIHLESIDIILQNLKTNPNFYNHGMSEEAYLQMEARW